MTDQLEGVVKMMDALKAARLDGFDVVPVSSDNLAKLASLGQKYGMLFQPEGECGFGRPCVGFIKHDKYVAHNPISYRDYEPIQGFADRRLYAPDGVTDAYHKHDCLAVLVHRADYNEAARQLLVWMNHLESLGVLEVAKYDTEADGLQAMLSGTMGWAIRIKGGAHDRR